MIKSIINSSVTVPKNYIGMCSANIVSVPSNVLHDTVRSWDYNGTNGYLTGTCVMSFINPSAGIYNWTTFDQLFGNNQNKQIVFVLGATPDYLVTRTATGSSYKGTKGNMCPDDLVGWSNAVIEVVKRAKNTFGRTGLIWQLWNEIDQTASYNDTISLLGPYTKATVQAIKSIDPTAIIISPPIAGANTVALPYIVNYLTSSDGAGAKVADYLDGVALHYYCQAVGQISQFDNPINYANAFKTFTGALADKGINLPVYITETGVLAADTTGGRKYQRRLLTFAALGAKLCLGYNYDSTQYPINGYVDQWNIVASKLQAGSKITDCILGMAKMIIEIDGIRYEF